MFPNTPQDWGHYYGTFTVNREFYVVFPDIQDIVKSLVRKQAEILVLGVGASGIGADFMKYNNYVTNIDFCKQVIDAAIAQQSPGDHIHMDARQLRFPDETFHLVFCKALLEFQDDVLSILQIIKEAHRVLDSKGGALLIITQLERDFVQKCVDVVPWQKVLYSEQKVNATCLNARSGAAAVTICACIR